MKTWLNRWLIITLLGCMAIWGLEAAFFDDYLQRSVPETIPIWLETHITTAELGLAGSAFIADIVGWTLFVAITLSYFALKGRHIVEYDSIVIPACFTLLAFGGGVLAFESFGAVSDWDKGPYLFTLMYGLIYGVFALGSAYDSYRIAKNLEEILTTKHGSWYEGMETIARNTIFVSTGFGFGYSMIYGLGIGSAATLTLIGVSTLINIALALLVFAGYFLMKLIFSKQTYRHLWSVVWNQRFANPVSTDSA